MPSNTQVLTNHTVTIAFKGGAVLGPFKGAWNKDQPGDVRELSREYDAYLQGESQVHYKFHLHDIAANQAHTLILHFDNVAAIYDQVDLS